MNEDTEVVPFTGFPFIYGFFLLMMCLFPVLTFLQYKGFIEPNNQGPEWLNWGMSVLFLLLAVFLYQFRKLKIEYKAYTLSVSYGFFRHQLDKEEIEDVYLDKANPILYYGGWGLRRGYVRRKFRLVYNIPRKPAVVISLRNRNKEFVFSTCKPDYWIKRLKE